MSAAARFLSQGRSAWIWVAAAMVLAAVLASVFLSTKSFWLDEAMSVHEARFERLPSVAFADGGNFALYYLLLHGWLRLGSSDGFVRALSVIAAVLAIPCIYLVGRRLFDTRVGIFAAFLLATNAFFISYAQEARGYTLFVLAGLLSTLFFVDLIERRAWQPAVLYVVASALMVYDHFFGVLVLAAHVVSALIVFRRQLPWTMLSLCYAAIALLLAPLAIEVHRHGTEGIAWVPPLSLAALGGFFVAVTGGALALLAYASAGIYAVLSSRSPSASPSRASAVTVVLIWVFVPVLACTLFSLAVRPIFMPRYLIIVAPMLAILAAAGLDRLASRPALYGALAFFALASVLGIRAAYSAPKEDWRGVAALIAARARPGDVVECTPAYAAIPLQHELDALAQPVPVTISRAALDGAADRLARIWVVERESAGLRFGFTEGLATQARAMTANAAERRKVRIDQSFFSIRVRLYER